MSASALIPLSRISAATGVPYLEYLTRVFPLDWGVPGHFVYHSGVVLVQVAKLPELAEALRGLGKVEAASKLEAMEPEQAKLPAKAWWREGAYA